MILALFLFLLSFTLVLVLRCIGGWLVGVFPEIVDELFELLHGEVLNIKTADPLQVRPLLQQKVCESLLIFDLDLAGEVVLLGLGVILAVNDYRLLFDDRFLELLAQFLQDLLLGQCRDRWRRDEIAAKHEVRLLWRRRNRLGLVGRWRRHWSRGRQRG